MKSYWFKGGIHPKYNKESTEAKETEKLCYEIGDNVYIPLNQHLGATAKEIVAKKDLVQTGQKIASSAGFISANIHSSANGEVEGIVKVPHPISGSTSAVKIKITELSDSFIKLENKDKLQDLILDAGIVGLGGATFPTHVKLSPPKPIDTLIINGAECEPYLTCDHRIMIENTEKILKGAEIVRNKLGIDKIIFGVEDNKQDVINKLKELAPKYKIDIISLHTKYPQGGEKQLIKATTDRVVPEGKLPMEIGVIVQNVGTLLSLNEAVEHGKPLFERVVTVTGAVKNSKNLLVKIGTPVSKLIEACGGFVGTPKKIIMGGPMMGFAVSSIDTPVMKGTSGIVVMREEDIPNMKKTNCIRCGRCIEACPMALVPVVMEQFALNNMVDKLIDFHVLNCIECGCCSFVCPARRPLVGYFKNSKKQASIIMRQREQK